MSAVDEYIAKIDVALGSDDEKKIGELVDEVASVFASRDPNIKVGLDRYECTAISFDVEPVLDNRGDLIKLRGKLLCLKESERSELESRPIHLALSTVDDDLNECEHYLLSEKDTEKEAQLFIDRMVQVYGSEIANISVGLGGYGYAPNDRTVKESLVFIKDHLRHYKARLAIDMAKGASNSVHVQTNAVNQTTVENVLTITQAIEQIQDIPENVLSEDLKNELKLLLLDMEMAKGKSKKEADGHLKKVLAWLADKGVDAAIAVLPYVLSVLGTLA